MRNVFSRFWWCEQAEKLRESQQSRRAWVFHVQNWTWFRLKSSVENTDPLLLDHRA